jgi:hypothetical protein
VCFNLVLKLTEGSPQEHSEFFHGKSVYKRVREREREREEKFVQQASENNANLIPVAQFLPKSIDKAQSKILSFEALIS